MLEARSEAGAHSNRFFDLTLVGWRSIQAFSSQTDFLVTSVTWKNLKRREKIEIQIDASMHVWSESSPGGNPG